MYVSSYSPIHNAFSNPSIQGWQSGQFAVPFQQSFAGAPQAGIQQGMQPMTGYSAVPYNVVSYGFSPAWNTGSMAPHTGSFVPGWNMNQASSFAGAPQGQLSSGYAPGFSSEYSIQSSSGITQPRVDIAETNTDLVLTAELPNVNPNDLNLTVTDDSVSISGYAHSSGMPSSIHRTVCLPTSIRSEQVNASYSNGILEARLPKSDTSVRRRIKVNPST